MELWILWVKNCELIHARVNRCVVDVYGKTIGITNEKIFNHLLRYEVDYLDGMTDILSANIIYEKLSDQVDEEGKIHMMIYDFINHRVGTNNAPISYIHYETSNRFNQNKSKKMDGNCMCNESMDQHIRLRWNI